jgi:hypothetical protein
MRLVATGAAAQLVRFIFHGALPARACSHFIAHSAIVGLAQKRRAGVYRRRSRLLG